MEKNKNLSIENLAENSENCEFYDLYCFGGKDKDDYPLKSISRLNSSSGQWENLISMFSGKFEFGIVSIDCKIYVAGGHSGRSKLQGLEVYDFDENLSKILQPMHQARSGHGMARLGDYIYVAGGWDVHSKDLSTVERYCIKSNVWTNVRSMKESRYGLQLILFDGELYAIGGYRRKTVEKYDPSNDEWKFVEKMKHSHLLFGATSHRDKIYVLSEKGFEMFNPTLNKWKSLPKLNVGFGTTLVSLNDKLLAVGGGSAKSGATPSVFEFDEHTQKWKQSSNMNVPRRYHCSVVMKNSLNTLKLTPNVNVPNKRVNRLRTDLRRFKTAVVRYYYNKYAPQHHPIISTKSKVPYLYCLGGIDDKSECLPSISMLKSFTEQWQSLPSMQMKRCLFGATWLEDKIYVAGGWIGGGRTDEMEYFDCSKEVWMKSIKMSRRRSALAMTTLNGYVYVAGGEDSNAQTLSSVERYSIVFGKWEEVQSMNEKRYGFQMLALEGYLYAIGGWGKKTVERYDPSSDTWQFISNLIHSHSTFGATIHKGLIYVLSENGFEMLDPFLLKWHSLPALKIGSGTTLVSFNGGLYALGGGEKANNSPTKTIHEFEINTKSWKELSEIDVARKLHCSVVVYH